MSFRVVSWNILSYLFSKPPDFQWDRRFPKIQSILVNYAPDLLQLQECQLEPRAKLIEVLKLQLVPSGFSGATEATNLKNEMDYRTGTGIFAGVRDRYGLLIKTGYSPSLVSMYNSDRFECIAYNVITSFKLASDSLGVLPTYYQKFLLQEKSTGKFLLGINVHLSNNSTNKDAHVARIATEATTLPTRIILNSTAVDNCKQYSTIVSGDFNLDARWITTWRRLTAIGLFKVINLDPNPSIGQGGGLAEPTRHENGWTVGCTHIDYIWRNSSLEVVKMFQGRFEGPPWASDHFPQICDLNM